MATTWTNTLKPFAKKTDQDIWLPPNTNWFSVYNAGGTDIKIIIGLALSEEEIQGAFAKFKTQPDIEVVEGKTGIVTYVPAGTQYEHPPHWPQIRWCKIDSNNNLMYVSSIG